MFELSAEEQSNWRSQFVTSNSSLNKGLRWRSMAFTEYGVAMLSGVLKSERAVQVNIAIVRAFIDMRRMISETRGLAEKLAEHEKKIGGLANDVRHMFDLLQPLLDGPTKKPGKIGFGMRQI